MTLRGESPGASACSRRARSGVQAIGQEGDEDMRFDPGLVLMEDRPDGEVAPRLRVASAPVLSGSCDRLQSYVRFRRNVANGRRRRADSTIAVRRSGAGSGAHHFRLAHLRFALMMTARAQPTTGRGGADGGDGG